MKRLTVLLLAACSSGPSVLQVQLRAATGQRPLAEADQVTFSLSDSTGRILATRRSPATSMRLALDPVPAGTGYVASLDGTFGGDEIARGISCPFDVVDNRPAPDVPLYFGAVGQFAATGAPAVARQGAVAFALGGGALLVSGDGGAGALATTELYAPSTGQFALGPTLGMARAGAVWAPLGDGSTIVIGGAAGFPAVESLLDGKWTAVPTLVPPGLVDSAAAALADGSALVCGGRVAGGAPLDSGWLIGSSAGGLGPDSPLLTARARHTLTLSGGDRTAALFVIGGVGVAGLVPDVEIYDPVTSSFAPYGLQLLAPRSDHTATRLPSGRILVAGGLDVSGQAVASTEVLDPVARRFLPAGSLAAARSLHSATLLPSGRVLVAGGNDASGAPTSSVEIFDPQLGESGAFVAAQPLTAPRAGHTVVPLCDGTLLIIGGGAGAERYVPIQ